MGAADGRKSALGKTAADALVRATMSVSGTASKVSGATQQVMQAAVFAKDVSFLSDSFKFMSDIGIHAVKHVGKQAASVAMGAGAGMSAGATAVAQNLFIATSGVGVVFGLMSVVGGLSSACSGACDAADKLDAQADAVCILLHTMLRMGRGTPVHDRIASRLPRLLAVEVHACKVTRPAYRCCLRRWDTYFSIAVGSRTRMTVPTVKVRSFWNTKVSSKVLLRALPGETSMTVQAYGQRGLVHRATLGNSSMGPLYTVDFGKPVDNQRFTQRVNPTCCLPSCICQMTCSMHLTARVLE